MKSVGTFVFIGVVSAMLFAWGATLYADPCLVVYSEGPCTYHYDAAVYYTVGPGDPLYDPLYDRGGKVLLMIGTNYLDLSIYQAPDLTGFVPTYDGNVGYFIDGTGFNLVVDGYSQAPTTYVNVLVMFDTFSPAGCTPVIYADGNLVTGGIYGMGDLVVSTPTPYGNAYSDTRTVAISWGGCMSIRIWAFADEDYNNKKEAGECFTAYTHDLTMVPVEDTTWGAVKALYR